MVRSIVAFVSALGCFLAGLAACSAGEPPAVLRQEIAVILSPATHEVTGESTVTVRPRGAGRLVFALAPAATVQELLVAGKAVPFTFADGILQVELPAGDGEIDVAVVYRSSFNDRPPADAVSGEDPTYGVKGVVAPQGVFLGANAGWYPAPAGVPARRTVRVTAPAGFEAITAGRRVSHGTAGGVTTSVWEEERPVEELALSAARYRIDEERLGTLPIYTYFSPENAHLAPRYLAAAVRYLRFYQELFGPYPFEKFAVVENFFPTGYGFPSYTLLGSTIIRLPFIPDTSLPHEIAHCWWGNGVLVDYREGNWSEGLVTYVADYLLEERKSPAAGRDYRLRLLTDYASLVTPDRDFPLREFTGRVDPASRAIGYGKGAMVFHMARKLTGDAAFFRALRELCREKLFTRASWSDFMRAFARVSGKDFAPFQDEWLNRPGGPHLSFAGVGRRPAGTGRSVAGEVVQTSPPFVLPLELQLETAGGSVRQTVSIERERTPFTFAATEPRRLLLDPGADVFRILAPGEIPPTVNRIKGSHSLLAVVTPECRADRETVRLLLASLDQPDAPIVEEKAASAERVAGHDLLICGIPARRLQPSLGRQTTVSRDGFTIDRQSFTSSDDLLFLVGHHPSDRERVAALFFPLSATAATKSVLKITHYGKYSYLAFRGGENRLKGIIPAASRESAIEFDAGEGR